MLAGPLLSQALRMTRRSTTSRMLLDRARQLRLPVPSLYDGSNISPMYRQSTLDGTRYFLSLEGEQKVRFAIREEEKHRSERWARRVSYINALIGLIGAVTGLVALLSTLPR